MSEKYYLANLDGETVFAYTNSYSSYGNENYINAIIICSEKLGCDLFSNVRLEKSQLLEEVPREDVFKSLIYGNRHATSLSYGIEASSGILPQEICDSDLNLGHLVYNVCIN